MLEPWKRWGAAEDKALDENFTVADNPLVRSSEELATERRMQRNMRALERDADMRNDPVRGQSYSEIMTMRYGGAE